MREITRLTRTETTQRLRKREISPLELIDAAEARIAEIEPRVNALPTLCFDRARDHAKRLMAVRSPAEGEEPGGGGGAGLVGRTAGLDQGPDRCGGGAHDVRLADLSRSCPGEVASVGG